MLPMQLLLQVVSYLKTIPIQIIKSKNYVFLNFRYNQVNESKCKTTY